VHRQARAGPGKPRACARQVGGPFAAERVFGFEEDPFTIERACKDKTPPNHKERALKEVAHRGCLQKIAERALYSQGPKNAERARS